MEKTNFENLDIYKLAEKLADEICLRRVGEHQDDRPAVATD